MNNFHFFPEIYPLTSRQYPADLLCHVAYVTSFNKCSDLGVKLSDV